MDAVQGQGPLLRRGDRQHARREEAIADAPPVVAAGHRHGPFRQTEPESSKRVSHKHRGRRRLEPDLFDIPSHEDAHQRRRLLAGDLPGPCLCRDVAPPQRRSAQRRGGGAEHEDQEADPERDEEGEGSSHGHPCRKVEPGVLTKMVRASSATDPFGSGFSTVATARHRKPRRRDAASINQTTGDQSSMRRRDRP